MESFRNVIKVASVEASNGDTSIHCHVDGVFLAELVHLVLVQAGVGEHANLAGSVAPVVFIAETFQL